MSNVPQDVIDDVKEAYKQVTGATDLQLADHVYEIANVLLQLRAQRSRATQDVIAAAEKYASKYDGDERQDIKTDVLNAYYAGNAQRSNAEPVIYVRIDALARLQKWGQLNMVGYNHPNHSPKPVVALYTATPDYDAGVAAGMMKAAEIAQQVELANAAYNDDKALVAAETARFIKREILSAIPAGSKAALREVCMKVVKELPVMASSKEIEAIVNSALEGKS